MSDINRLMEMRRKAHEAGDADAARRYTQRIQEAKSAGQAPAPTDTGSTLGNLVGGMKHGFDKAAYALADFAPEIPISQESRDSWNNNPIVKTVGLTIPSRDQRKSALAAGKRVADGSTAGAVGDFIGNAAPNLAAGIATAGTSLLPAALAQAGLTYMTTPGETGDRSKAAAFAAGGEGVGRMLPHALARFAKPINATPAAQRLINEGVYPTPGQALGGGFKKLEDGLTSAPGLGAAVSRGQADALAQANSLAMSQGGIKVPAGREGFKQLDNYFDKAFDNATSRLAFDLNDPAYDAGVQAIMRNRNLDKAGIDDITGFFNNYRANTNMPAPNPNATGLTVPGQAPLRQLVGGEDFHAMLQQLRNEGSAFRKSQDPFQNRLGEAYRDIYNLTDNALSTQGLTRPTDVDIFRNVRREYANVVPALRTGELTTVNRHQGIFTPEQYQNSLVANAKKMGNKASVRKGTLPQQQLADDMVEVMGGKYPDSGTAYRLAINGGIPVGAALVDPSFGLATAAGIGAGYLGGRALYSEPGRKFMVGGYGWQNPLSQYLRRQSPTLGTLGASTLSQYPEE
jgi:hypothetical protein